MLRQALAFVTLVCAGTAAPLAQAAPSSGEVLFQQRCTSCHSVTAGGSKIGPTLKGVVGRKAAAAAGYTYSKALVGSRLTWTRTNLDKFLAKPSGVVPGTKMMIGLTDPTQRAAVISYLAIQK